MASDTSSDPSPAAPPARRGWRTWLLRLAAVVLGLVCLVAAAGVTLWVAYPATLIEGALALAAPRLRARGLSLEYRSLTATSAGEPRFEGLRLRRDGGEMLEVVTATARLPVVDLARAFLDLADPGRPLEARLRLAGVDLQGHGGAAQVAALDLELDVRALLGQGSLPSGLRVTGARALFEGRPLLRLEQLGVSLPGWASAPASLPVSLTLSGGALDLPALRRAQASLASSASTPATSGSGGAGIRGLALGSLVAEDLELDLGGEARTLLVDVARYSPGDDAEGASLEAELRTRAEGRGSLRLGPDRETGRLRGHLDVHALPLEGLPLSLVEDLAVGGILAGRVTLDLAPEAPEDLSQCRGDLTLRGGWLRRGGASVASGVEVRARLGATSQELEAAAEVVSLAGLAALVPGERRHAPAGSVGVRLRLEGDDERGQGRLEVTRGPLRVAGLDLGGAVCDASWTASEVRVAGLELRLAAGGPPILEASARIPRAHPTRLEGRARLRASGLVHEALPLGSLAASILVTPGAVSILDLEASLPSGGPVTGTGRGELEIPALEGGGSPVLEDLATLATGNPSPLEGRWTLRALELESRDQGALSLEHVLRGRVRFRPLQIRLDPVALETLETTVALEGVVGAAPTDVLRASLGALDLARLLELVGAPPSVALRGRLAHARGALQGALGDPSVEAELVLEGPTEVSLWSARGADLLRRGLRLPAQTIQVRARPAGVSLVGEHLSVRAGPTTSSALHVRLDRLPIEFTETLFPARRSLAAYQALLSASAVVSPVDPLRSRATLELAARATTPTSSLPASLVLSAAIDAERVALDHLALVDGEGVVRAQARVAVDGRQVSPFSLALDEFPTRWLSRLGGTVPVVQRVSLRASGEIEALTGPADRVVLERLADRLGRLREAGVPYLRLQVERFEAWDAAAVVARLERPFQVEVRKDRLEVQEATLRIDDHPLTLRGVLTRRGPSNLRILPQQVPLSGLVALAAPGRFSEVAGVLDGSFSVSGRYPALVAEGRVGLEGMALRIPFLDSRLVGSVRAEASTTGIALVSPGLAIDGVPLVLQGGLSFTEADPVASARLVTRGLRLKRGRSSLEGIDLDLAWSCPLWPLRPRLRGTLRFGSGSLVLDDAGPVFLLRRLSSLTGARSTSLVAPLDLDLSISLPVPIQVRSPLLDVALTASASVRGGPERPTQVEVVAEVSRGSIFLHRSEFRITRGRASLQLVGDVFTSDLRLAAEARVEDHRVRIEVTGTVDDPVVRIESTPPRSEAELIHLLTTGNLPGEGQALTGVGSGLRDFYLTSSLNRFLSSSLGLREVRVRKDEGGGRIELDKQLSDRTTVSYSRGTDASETLRIEHRLGSAVSIEAGQRSDLEGSRPFVGVTRRIRLR